MCTREEVAKGTGFPSSPNYTIMPKTDGSNLAQCPMSAADIGTIANKHLCISLAVYAPIKVGSAPNVGTNVI